MPSIIKLLVVALGFLFALLLLLTTGQRIEQTLLTDAEARLALIRAVSSLFVLIGLAFVLLMGWRLRRSLWGFIKR